MATSPIEGSAMNSSVKEAVAGMTQQQVTVMVWDDNPNLVMIDFKRCAKNRAWPHLRAQLIVDMGRYLNQTVGLEYFKTTVDNLSALVKLEDFSYDQYMVADAVGRFLVDQRNLLVKNLAFGL